MKYKMVVVDMDGTLLDDNKNIPESNIKTLRTLFKMGVIIIIATGRRYFFAKPVLEALKIPLIVLPNNGNCIWIMDEDRKISAKYLAEDIFHRILEEGHNRELYPILHVDKYDEGYDYVTEYDASHSAYHSYIGQDNQRHEVISNLYEFKNPNVMIMCYAAPLNSLKDFQFSIQNRFPDSIHSHITMSLKRIGPLLEISHISGTKWQTAIEYASSIGISPEEIIAIGDDFNDITMIKNAGLGIAMKNALPQVKESAHIITKLDNNNAGLAHVLKSTFSLSG